MASVNKNVDYRNLAEFYKIGGTVPKARKLYIKKYGHIPTWNAVKRAVLYFGDEDCKKKWHKNERKRVKKESSPPPEPEQSDPQTSSVPEVDPEPSPESKDEAVHDDMAITQINELQIEVSEVEDTKELVRNLTYSSESEDTIDQTQIDRHAIIYTTRLDDMKIFKEVTDNLSIKNIIQSIATESKPTFNTLPEICSSKHNETSYQNVEDKVRLFNDLATNINNNCNENDDAEENLLVVKKAVKEDLLIDEVGTVQLSRRSKKLLKSCKELFVVLTDIKPQLRNRTRVIIRKKQKKTRIMEPLTLRRIIGNFRHFMSVFVFIDVYCNSTELYFYNDEDNTWPFCYVDADIKNLNLDDLDIRVIKFRNCCWFKRKKNIDTILYTYLEKKPCGFLKKTHLCRPCECTCCCRVESLNKNTPVTITAEKKNATLCYHRLVKDSLKYEQNWINFALFYYNEKRNETKETLTKTYEYSKTGKKTYDFTFKSNNVGEQFKLKTNGEISNYIFGIYNHKINLPNPSITCCWNQREKIVSSMDIVKRKSYFFRTKRRCLPNQCACCCKKELGIVITLKEINLPSSPEYSKNCTNKYVKALKRIKKPCVNRISNFNVEDKTFNSQNLPIRGRSAFNVTNEESSFALVPMTPHTGLSVPPVAGVAVTAQPGYLIPSAAPTTMNPHAGLALPSVTPTAISAQAGFSLPSAVPKATTAQAGLTLPSVAPTTMTAQSGLSLPLIPPVLTNTTRNEQIIPNCSDDPVVNALMKNILERFKNIRLTIDSNGKVAAELNVPAHNLSTDELKVLSNILSHVQEQVNALGIATCSQIQNVSNLQLGNPVMNSNMSLNNNVSSVTPIAETSEIKMEVKEEIAEEPAESNLVNNVQTNNVSCLPIISNVFGATSMPFITIEGIKTSANTQDTQNPNTSAVSSFTGNLVLGLNQINAQAGSSNNYLSNPTTTIPVPTIKLDSIGKVIQPSQENLINDPKKTIGIDTRKSLDVYEHFAKLTKWKYEQYQNSFKSFLSERQTSVPKIQSVFSLNNASISSKNKENQLEPSTSRTGYSSNYLRDKGSASGVKRKRENNKAVASSSKIRVESASHLQNNVQAPQMTDSISVPTTDPLTNNGNMLLREALLGVQHTVMIPPVNSIVQPMLVTVPNILNNVQSVASPLMPNNLTSNVLTNPTTMHFPGTSKKGSDSQPVASTSKNDDVCILGV